MAFEIIHGDCLEVMRGMADNSVDAVVTDPPYGLSFMGKKWDYDVPSVEVWAECLRVLKPGGHLLAFAGTRTQHRMAVRIEDAGFEIRDMIAWVYGSGFPKSLDVSKAIDKAAGAEREVVGMKEKTGGGRAAPSHEGWQRPWMQEEGARDKPFQITAPATPAACQWAGWGTALKPSYEPVTVARKPLAGTVAANVLEHGTGALNIDGCRIDAGGESLSGGMINGTSKCGEGWDRPWRHDEGTIERNKIVQAERIARAEQLGRWPANLIHDGSEEVMECFPQTKGGTAVRRNGGGNTFGGDNPKPPMQDMGYGDTGSAARFFYGAKASKKDRDEGLERFEAKRREDQSAWIRKCNVCGDTFCDPVTSSPHCGHNDFGWVEPSARRNVHPTVKPTDLMRYLCRLVTPPGGTVLDPFTGSGSTGKAAVLEGFNFIGIEREAEYVAIAEARIVEAQKSLGLFA